MGNRRQIGYRRSGQYPHDWCVNFMPPPWCLASEGPLTSGSLAGSTRQKAQVILSLAASSHRSSVIWRRAIVTLWNPHFVLLFLSIQAFDGFACVGLSCLPRGPFEESRLTRGFTIFDLSGVTQTVTRPDLSFNIDSIGSVEGWLIDINATGGRADNLLNRGEA